MSVANVGLQNYFPTMNVERTASCLVNYLHFAVTYSVANDSDLVGPSFKDGYSQL
jgi:hypothetical protein